MPLRSDMDLWDYLKILERKKWLVIFTFLFVLFGAVVYNVVTPEQYKSTTTILIIPQRVPENYVQSTVSIGVADRLATIQQQVMSRTRLTMVMEELSLFGRGHVKTPPEVWIETMRKRIEIDVVRDNRRGQGTEAFSISFSHQNPKLAMLTASRLASLFIEENLKTREQQAVGTSEFLDSQLKETKVNLEKQEERLKQYKLRFMGELPQELQANLTALTRLQDQYKTNADGIQAAQDRKIFLEAQLGILGKNAQSIALEERRAPSITAQDPIEALMAEIASKRARLADLSTKYTERYPEVTQIHREIGQLEVKLAQMRKSSPSTDNAAENKEENLVTVPLVSSQERGERIRLKAQIAATEAEISALKQKREDIEKTIANFQSKVERSPRREQEMISLTRDYENQKQSYNDLLKKKLEADISQNLEKRQKGEQFQIIDPANYPEKPFKPDRRRVFGISFLLACVLGFGGAIGLEMADPALRNPKDFKYFFNLPILAMIPVVPNGVFKRRRTIRKAFIFGGIIFFTVAASTFLLIYGQKIRTLLDF